MHENFSHTWIVAPYRRDREQVLPPREGLSSSIDCHRHLRGPYTGVGELLRRLVPEVYQQWPDHVLAHGDRNFVDGT